MAKLRHLSRNEKKPRRVQQVIIRQRTGSDYYDENGEASNSPEKINVYADDNIDYDDFDGDYGGHRRFRGDARKRKKQKRLLIILGALVLVLAVSLVATNGQLFSIIGNRFKVALMGTGVGDGFPVEVTGNNISQRGFLSTDYGCVTLSDTALTAVDSTGKTLYTVRHSYSSPMLSERDGSFIVYDCGSYGYCTVDSSGNENKYTCDNKIISADIAEDGSFAVLSIPEDYASQLEVYDSTGTLKYVYKFSENYGSAVGISPDGTKCAVSVLYTENAELYSKITVLSISSANPLCEYVYKGCMVSDVFWNDSGIFCIGDEGIATGNASGNFTEHSFSGKNLTAVYADDSRCYVSVSSYEHSGDSDLLVYSDISGDPLDIYLSERISGISTSGSVVAVLAGQTISTFSQSSGKLESEINAGYDTRAIALEDSSTSYVLGAEEIRSLSLVE